MYQIDLPGSETLGQVVVTEGGCYFIRYMRQSGGQYVIEDQPPLFDTLEEATAYVLMMADRT